MDISRGRQPEEPTVHMHLPEGGVPVKKMPPPGRPNVPGRPVPSAPPPLVSISQKALTPSDAAPGKLPQLKPVSSSSSGPPQTKGTPLSLAKAAQRVVGLRNEEDMRQFAIEDAKNKAARLNPLKEKLLDAEKAVEGYQGEVKFHFDERDRSSAVSSVEKLNKAEKARQEAEAAFKDAQSKIIKGVKKTEEHKK